jgi:hypothetical protein
MRADELFFTGNTGHQHPSFERGIVLERRSSQTGILSLLHRRRKQGVFAKRRTAQNTTIRTVVWKGYSLQEEN